MKDKYKLFIGAFIVLAISFIIWLVYFTDNKELPVDQLIQGLSIFVAIIAVIVAISASDPKSKNIKIKVTPSVDKKSVQEYHKSRLINELKTEYVHFPEVFRSYKVFFRVKNHSEFDLSKPIVTFELDSSLQHPAEPERPDHSPLRREFHSNLYGLQKSMVHFWSGDNIILANNNFPFWNKGRTYVFWIEMVVDEVNYSPIEVLLSVNCDNGEGISETIVIYPADFLNDKNIN